MTDQISKDEIYRLGESRRWADVVIHRGVARFVEVAENPALDMTGQVQQVLSQIDATLTQIGADRTRLLEVLIFVADLSEMPALNAAWDQWVSPGQSPVRACVQAGLAAGYRLEAVVTAATSPS